MTDTIHGMPPNIAFGDAQANPDQVADAIGKGGVVGHGVTIIDGAEVDASAGCGGPLAGHGDVPAASVGMPSGRRRRSKTRKEG